MQKTLICSILDTVKYINNKWLELMILVIFYIVIAVNCCVKYEQRAPMNVVKTRLHSSTVYILTDDAGRPVEEVARYVKRLVAKGYSPNTLRSYCTALKFYYEFLSISGLDYRDVKIGDLTSFVIWLQSPSQKDRKVVNVSGKPRRSPSTTNHYITVVGEFYRFLSSEGLVSAELAAKLEVTRCSRMGSRVATGLLSHASNKHGKAARNPLKAKVPRKRPKSISPEEASALLAATSNQRDGFLVMLLLETGLRIGEALGLLVQDFSYDQKADQYSVDVVDRGYHPNGGSAKTHERRIPVTRELVEFFDDYVYDTLGEIGGEHPYVFVKLRGDRRGEPMEYEEARQAFERYSRKIGVHVTPHMLRHTFGTLLYSETKDLKLVQELLGHSSISTTADIYLHPTADDVYEGWSKASHRLATATMSSVRKAASVE